MIDSLEVEVALLTSTALMTLQRCMEKIANPPRLAIPSVAALGPPPEGHGGSDPAQWDVAKRALADYAAKLGRCAAALAEADQRYRAPLEERDDLRGLLGGYRARAAAKGLAEDAVLDDKYNAAKKELFTAPCDLEVARSLVAAYQAAVRVAVGAATVIEPKETQA